MFERRCDGERKPFAQRGIKCALNPIYRFSLIQFEICEDARRARLVIFIGNETNLQIDIHCDYHSIRAHIETEQQTTENRNNQYC